jgi:uncharacterized protein (TIGR03382 family)
MEDYELLALAKKLGFEAQAKAIAKGVYPVTYQATTSPAALDSARHDLAAMILKAMGKSAPPPPAVTVTPDGAGNPPGTIAANAAGFPAGGCSSSGPQTAWLAIPLFALVALRRRKSA